MEAIECFGLVVPKREAARFEQQVGEFEGLPDLGVGNAARCVKLCRSFGTAIDVGAHIGAVSLYLARRFRRVISFEPVPPTFEFLERNTACCTNIEALNVAAGSNAGEVYFSHYPKHGQLSHVTSNKEEPGTHLVGPVPACTIDSLDLSDVSFIKIDVEGYELPVLEGARATIQRCHPLILVEQGGNDEKHFGRPRNEASGYLEALGMHQHPEAPPLRIDRLYTF